MKRSNGITTPLVDIGGAMSTDAWAHAARELAGLGAQGPAMPREER